MGNRRKDVKLRFYHIPVLALLLLVILTPPNTAISGHSPTHDDAVTHSDEAVCNEAHSESTDVCDQEEKRKCKGIIAVDACLRACLTVAKAAWRVVETVVVMMAKVLVQSMVAIGLGLLHLLMPA